MHASSEGHAGLKQRVCTREEGTLIVFRHWQA
jgi:hypothetical protein